MKQVGNQDKSPKLALGWCSCKVLEIQTIPKHCIPVCPYQTKPPSLSGDAWVTSWCPLKLGPFLETHPVGRLNKKQTQLTDRKDRSIQARAPHIKGHSWQSAAFFSPGSTSCVSRTRRCDLAAKSTMKPLAQMIPPRLLPCDSCSTPCRVNYEIGPR